MLWFTKKKEAGPVVRARAEHNISRRNIAPEALQVLYRLSDAGFYAYLVGGGVRDLLLGREPKDFDVATDALPQQIRKLFRNARLIGRRFRLALICFKDRQIETSTFRREPDPSEVDDGSRPGSLYRSEDNLFGTPEQDALRRDFTVNGLFYDIRTFNVIDYVGGLEDLERRILRSIGDPNVRFREDPVRMMRAVRFAAKLDFEIHRDSRKAILRHHAEIGNASPPRLFEETTRLFGVGAEKAFRLLSELRLMGDLLPAVEAYIRASGRDRSPLWPLLAAFDAKQGRVPAAEDSALRFAVLLQPLFADRLRADRRANRQTPADIIAADLVGDVLVNPFAAHTWCPPRSLCEDIARILSAQTLLDVRQPGQCPPSMSRRDWFPSAILLFRLRAEVAGADLSLADAWDAFARRTGAFGRVRSPDEVFLDGRLPRSPAEREELRAERRAERQRRRKAKAARSAERRNVDKGANPDISANPDNLANSANGANPDNPVNGVNDANDPNSSRPRRRRHRHRHGGRGNGSDGAPLPQQPSP